MREKIFHMAGAKTPEEQTVETLEHAIRQAGRTPAQRDSYYNHLTGPNAIRPRAKPRDELVCA
jgi:aminodeoxyfutalosine synthase